MHIHFLNDFALRIRFGYPDGSDAPVPDGVVAVSLSTSSFGPVYVARPDAGTLRNDGNSIEVFVRRHRLAPGDLTLAISLAVPDTRFPDGLRNCIITVPAGVTLSRDHSCFIIPPRIIIPVILPFFPASGETPGPEPSAPPDIPGSGDASEEEVDSAIADAFGSLGSNP